MVDVVVDVIFVVVIVVVVVIVFVVIDVVVVVVVVSLTFERVQFSKDNFYCANFNRTILNRKITLLGSLS